LAQAWISCPQVNGHNLLGRMPEGAWGLPPDERRNEVFGRMPEDAQNGAQNGSNARRPVSSPNKKGGATLDNVLSFEEDSFDSLSRALSKEHKKQINELKRENKKLKDHLDLVLGSTWNLSQEDWIGDTRKPKKGNLQLMCIDGEHPRDENSLHEVPEEQFAKIAAATGAKHATRVLWNTEGKDEKIITGMRKSIQFISNFDVDEEEEEEEEEHAFCVMHPYGNTRTAWDVAGAFMMLWDVITVPLGAFEPEENILFVFMDFSTLVFWTMDIIATFFTGYERHGEVIMRRKYIALNYIGGMFFVDFTIVSVDMFFSLLKLTDVEISFGIGSENLPRLARAFRILRIYRLTKLKKLRRMLFSVMDKIKSEKVFIIPQVTQLMVGIIGLSHLLGSVWYLIGTIGKSLGANNWIQGDINSEDITVLSLEYRYFVCLGWAMHNFALASSTIKAQNGVEAFYSIVVELLGLSLFLFFISVLTVSFMEMRSLQGESIKELWLFRRFLHQREVPGALKFRLLNFLEVQAKNQVELLPEGNVRLLTFLSDQLRAELDFNISYSRLFIHPVLQKMDGKAHSLKDLTSKALDTRMFAEDDMVAAQDQPSEDLLFVMSGTLTYTKRGQEAAAVTLDEEDWLCEASLWIYPWHWHGNLMVTITAELIYLNSAAFCDVIEHDLSLWALFSQYAQKFCDKLNDMEKSSITDVHISDKAINESLMMIRGIEKKAKKSADLRSASKEAEAAPPSAPFGMITVPPDQPRTM